MTRAVRKNWSTGSAWRKPYTTATPSNDSGGEDSLMIRPRIVSARCSLVWKFHDSWPQMYSSKVDYFLPTLIPYHIIKRSYAPVLVSIEVGTYIHVWVVNDTLEPLAQT